MQPDQKLLTPVLIIDRRRMISDRYGRFYAPLAVVMVFLAYLPLFNDVREDDFTTSYGTIFTMAGRSGGNPAVLGLILFAGLIGVLAAASVVGRSVGPPIAIVVLGLLIALMLITKPGTGDPTPSLSDSGVAGLALVFLAVGLAVTHAIHVWVVPNQDSYVEARNGVPT
jgi:hypothetical protein